MGLTLTHLLTFLEYEELRLGAFGEVKFRGPFDATYDLARGLGEQPELADWLPTCQLVACDELHDMNEASSHPARPARERKYARPGLLCRRWRQGPGDPRDLGADPQYLRERFDHAFPS